MNNNKYDEPTTQEAVRFQSFNQINVAEKTPNHLWSFFVFKL